MDDDKETPKPKSEVDENASKAPSSGPFDSSASNASSDRRSEIRQKRESSLRELNRRLDETIGIQASPGPTPTSRKKRGLAEKVKEVDFIREKFRMSFNKVIKNS